MKLPVGMKDLNVERTFVICKSTLTDKEVKVVVSTRKRDQIERM